MFTFKCIVLGTEINVLKNKSKIVEAQEYCFRSGSIASNLSWNAPLTIKQLVKLPASTHHRSIQTLHWVSLSKG